MKNQNAIQWMPVILTQSNNLSEIGSRKLIINSITDRKWCAERNFLTNSSEHIGA